MPTFNRNIITGDDVAKLQAAVNLNEVPKTLASSPPAGVSRLANIAAAPADPSPGVTIPTADDYLTKLLKYVPLEILGAYLFLAGVVNSNVTKPHDLAIWLGALLGGTLVLAVPYDISVLGVVRPVQIIVSLVGLTIYIFSVGGWFATTTWYHAWYATIALPLFGLLVAIIKLNALPTAG